MTVLGHDVDRADETKDERTTGPRHPSGVSLCFVEGQPYLKDGKNVPQGLKALISANLYGTAEAEAVPFV
jgi:hypothetical protein